MRTALVLIVFALAPAGAAAQVTARAPVAQVPVQVRSASEGVTLHHVLVEGRRSRWTGRYADASRPVCTAPCEMLMPVGTYRFALSDGGDPRRVERLVDLRAPSLLSLEYENRDGLRTTGWAIFGGGALIGAITALVGALMVLEPDQEDLGYGLMIGGLSAIAVGGLISIPFVGFQDHAEIGVGPLQPMP